MSKREFKPLSENVSSIEFVRPSKLAAESFKGTVFEGEYVGEVVNQFNPDKPDYKFTKEDGTTVIVNACGSISHQMKQVVVGDYIQLSYIGQKKIDKGILKGKTCHEFKILKA